MLVDHLIYAAFDLATAVADSGNDSASGPGGKHWRQAQGSVLAPSTYLEIIAPDPEQPEPSVPALGVEASPTAGWLPRRLAPTTSTGGR